MMSQIEREKTVNIWDPNLFNVIPASNGNIVDLSEENFQKFAHDIDTEFLTR